MVFLNFVWNARTLQSEVKNNKVVMKKNERMKQNRTI